MFGYDTATTCGKTTQPKPATDEWENVTCSHCFSIGLLKTAWAAADRFESRVWFAGRLFDIKIEVEGLPRLGFDGPIDRSSTHVCHLSEERLSIAKDTETSRAFAFSEAERELATATNEDTLARRKVAGKKAPRG